MPNHSPTPSPPSRRWGHCQNCRYFGSPSPVPLGTEEAPCLNTSLGKYELLVFGAGGCSEFELRPGLSTTVEDPAPPPPIPRHVAHHKQPAHARSRA